MTDFGDDLRALLAKKKEQFFVRQMQEERQRQAANRLRDDTRRAAERLAREVFLPLLEEFRDVMEAADVLCGGVVEQGAPSREHGVQGKEHGAGSTEYAATPRSPLPAPGFSLPAPRSVLCLRAAGSAPGSPHVEIRIASAAGDDGSIEVSVECLDTTAGEFGQGAGSTEQGVQGREHGAGSTEYAATPRSPLPAPSSPLLTLPSKTFKAAATNHDAVRQWCAGLLKKCGEACLEANRDKR